MNLKLITEHKDYLLLVDTEAKITKGSYFLLGDKYINRYEGTNEERYKTHLSEPIIAHLPLNNAPTLEGVPLLPELPKQEEDEERLGNQYISGCDYMTKLGVGEKPIRIILEGHKKSFIAGYKATSKKWSDGDMLKAFQQGWKRDEQWREWFPNYKSLATRSTPIGFEPEYEHPNRIYYDGVQGLKTVNGVLQGTYKF